MDNIKLVTNTVIIITYQTIVVLFFNHFNVCLFTILDVPPVQITNLNEQF